MSLFQKKWSVSLRGFMQHLMGFKGYLREILRVYDVSPKETLKCHLKDILCNALNCNWAILRENYT